MGGYQLELLLHWPSHAGSSQCRSWISFGSTGWLSQLVDLCNGHEQPEQGLFEWNGTLIQILSTSIPGLHRPCGWGCCERCTFVWVLWTEEPSLTSGECEKERWNDACDSYAWKRIPECSTSFSVGRNPVNLHMTSKQCVSTTRSRVGKQLTKWDDLDVGQIE